MTIVLKEDAEIVGVDSALVVSVDSSEGCKGRVVISDF